MINHPHVDCVCGHLLKIKIKVFIFKVQCVKKKDGHFINRISSTYINVLSWLVKLTQGESLFYSTMML